ncbi:MAG: SipW-dependent-type signal peptide-containing protein, partial [Christensenellales bacterium]
MSRKIIAVAAVIILAAVGIVGGTLAWFTDAKTAENTIATGKIEITILENGEAADGKLTYTGLMPGDLKTDTVAFQLADDSAEAWLRAKVEVDWDNNDLDPNMVIFTYGDGWDNGDDGWYYYGSKVSDTLSIPTFITQVKFSTEADNK